MAVIKSLKTNVVEEKQSRWSSADNSLYNTSRWRIYRTNYIKYRLSLGHSDCDVCGRLFQAKTNNNTGIEIDHVKPISQGGEMYDYDNLQMLCHVCHTRKTAKEIRQRNDAN